MSVDTDFQEIQNILDTESESEAHRVDLIRTACGAMIGKALAYQRDARRSDLNLLMKYFREYIHTLRRNYGASLYDFDRIIYLTAIVDALDEMAGWTYNENFQT